MVAQRQVHRSPLPGSLGRFPTPAASSLARPSHEGALAIISSTEACPGQVPPLLTRGKGGRTSTRAAKGQTPACVSAPSCGPASSRVVRHPVQGGRCARSADPSRVATSSPGPRELQKVNLRRRGPADECRSQRSFQMDGAAGFYFL